MSQGHLGIWVDTIMSGSNDAQTANQRARDDHVVKLPGERTSWKATVPRVDVRLPATAHSRIDRSAWIVLLFSLTILATAVKTSTDLSATLHHGALVVTLLLWLCGIRTLIGFVALLLDSNKSLPNLTIDLDGFVDRRAGEQKILWREIATVDISFGGPYGGVYESVHLETRGTISVKRFPLRLGALPYLWRRSERVMIVSVLHMDTPAQRLALLIVTLAGTNGALNKTRHRLLHPKLLDVGNPPSKSLAVHS
jgi:hypothetical protein